MKRPRGREGKKANHDRKWLIQIRTNTRGWTTVEYVGTKSGKIIVRLSDGQLVRRHLNQVRYGVPKRVPHENPLKRKSNKKYKTKKKRKKLRKPPRRSKKKFIPKRKRKFDVDSIRLFQTDN